LAPRPVAERARAFSKDHEADEARRPASAWRRPIGSRHPDCMGGGRSCADASLRVWLNTLPDTPPTRRRGLPARRRARRARATARSLDVRGCGARESVSLPSTRLTLGEPASDADAQ